MAESPDSKASKSLTFRLPNEIYSELEQFAIAKGLLKSDGAIKTTDALIAVIKEGLGLSNGVSQNVSISDERIEVIVQSAVNALVTEKIEPMHNSIKQAIATLDSLKLSKELIDEAIASAKKPLRLSPQLRAIALQKESQAA